MATTYQIDLPTAVMARQSYPVPGRVVFQLTLPTESEDTEFVLVSREDGVQMIGIELSHGETVAGHWPAEEPVPAEDGCLGMAPGGDDWVDELRVVNALGFGPANAETGVTELNDLLARIAVEERVDPDELLSVLRTTAARLPDGKWLAIVSDDDMSTLTARDEADDDMQECTRCHDRVHTLSSQGLCDGCIEQEERNAEH